MRLLCIDPENKIIEEVMVDRDLFLSQPAKTLNFKSSRVTYLQTAFGLLVKDDTDEKHAFALYGHDRLFYGKSYLMNGDSYLPSDSPFSLREMENIVIFVNHENI